MDANLQEKTVPTPSQPPWMTRAPQIDTNKRYDIYCQYHPNRSIVYRNIKFKDEWALPGKGSSMGKNFLAIEQEDGSEIFLSEMRITMFCEHGVMPAFVEVSEHE